MSNLERLCADDTKDKLVNKIEVIKYSDVLTIVCGHLYG